MLHHSATGEYLVQGSSAACPPSPVSRCPAGLAAVQLVRQKWGVTQRIAVPAPSHRQQRALLTSCSLVHLSPPFTNKETQGCSHNPKNKSLFAETL